MAPEELVARLERMLKKAEKADLDEWLTVQEAADLTKFAPAYFRDHRNQLDFMFKIGREDRVSRAGLAKWMKSHKVN